jgi:hypothetical protein
MALSVTMDISVLGVIHVKVVHVPSTPEILAWTMAFIVQVSNGAMN